MVLEPHVVRLHIVHAKEAVGPILVARLLEDRIAKPPWTPVSCPPPVLVHYRTPHHRCVASVAFVQGSAHIHDQIRLLGVAVNALPEGIVDGKPVVFAARRPNFVTNGARILLIDFVDLQSVLDHYQTAG